MKYCSRRSISAGSVLYQSNNTDEQCSSQETSRKGAEDKRKSLRETVRQELPMALPISLLRNPLQVKSLAQSPCHKQIIRLQSYELEPSLEAERTL
jgi:hypothetical protein